MAETESAMLPTWRIHNRTHYFERDRTCFGYVACVRGEYIVHMSLHPCSVALTGLLKRENLHYLPRCKSLNRAKKSLEEAVLAAQPSRESGSGEGA